MKKVLFVNACVRGEASRSLSLARCFLNELHNAEIQELDLPSLGLVPLDAEGLSLRDGLAKNGDFAHPIFEYARDFRDCDAVVIAAPYWDMSFPSMLRVYLERLFVIGLTFHYDSTGTAVGDCRPARLLLVTTRGGNISDAVPDFASAYLRAACGMLGVAQFDCLAAEGLDIVGADAEALLCAAEIKGAELAKSFL